ncbi:hypothetical protein [Chitinophaga sp. MD30]|uniref:hypothetical protein n=2 Tax=Chitinophaga TaxID=79328 RepID=UPI000BB0C7BA|nr:hypothetical protein [Chitinophaga sp. MD30]ASZ13739.1 hypothetical protein CK934_23680 [Chitinophaga sp. MD30]
MNNVQKAKLLSELLPEEIPGYLEFTKYLCDIITSDPVDFCKQWKENPIIGPYDWISYATEAKRIIIYYDKKLTQSSKLFSDQLFDGMLALYTVHCLEQYPKQEKTSVKFKLACDLIFSSNN